MSANTWASDALPDDALVVGYSGVHPIVEWRGHRFTCYWQSPCERTGQPAGFWMNHTPDVLSPMSYRAMAEASDLATIVDVERRTRAIEARIGALEARCAELRGALRAMYDAYTKGATGEYRQALVVKAARALEIEPEPPPYGALLTEPKP